jgi:4'-phosphopantetheinyl transferase EntD
MVVELMQLFPPTVRVVELSDPDLAEPLFPEEELAVARAVEKRRVEFALGRTAARKALGALGIAPVALPANPDRSVAWPDGVCGSITHAERICAAVAALRSDHAGLGIDAEVNGRVQRNLWSHVATAREIAWFEAQSDELEAARRATLLFSAKEAFYKAQFCKSRAWVGFHDAELTFDASGAFEVELLIDVADVFARGQRFAGRYAFTAQHVLTSVVLPPNGGRSAPSGARAKTSGNPQ